MVSHAASSDGVPTGTSFPGAPVLNDRYYRTDRNVDYYYDGTRWLSTQLHELHTLRSGTGYTVGSNQVGAFANPYSGLYDIWAESVLFEYYMDVTGNWTINFYKQVGLTDTIIATTTLSTVNAHTATRVAVGAVVASTIVSFTTAIVKNSGSSTIYPCASLVYRLVG